MPGCPLKAPDINAVKGAGANMKNGLGNLSASDVDPVHHDHQEPAEKPPVPARAH
jgi:hypothetical protein